MTTDNTTSTSSRYRPPASAVLWIIRGLMVIACAFTGLLIYQSLAAGILPGCGGESGCEEVLASRWARWLGIPVATMGLILYSIFFGLTFHIGPSATVSRQRITWLLLLAVAISVMGAAVWLIATQAVDLKVYCKYCLTAHTCALVAGLLVFFNAPIGRRRVTDEQTLDPIMLGPSGLATAILLGVLPVGALISGQLFGPQTAARITQVEAEMDSELLAKSPRLADTDTGPGPDRIITILAGRVELTPHKYPVLGSADAPVMLVNLFDYTCPHCRRFHAQLQGLRSRYGEQVGIIALPVPLNADCNSAIKKTMPQHESACDLARIALAVWKARPDVFEEFDDWLFTPTRPPSAEQAMRYAGQLVGSDQFNQALASPWPLEQIRNDVMLFRFTTQLLGRNVLPQLIVANSIFPGQTLSQQQLFEKLEELSPLRPKTPQP